MNKIQIKAEVLATVSALLRAPMLDSDMLIGLKSIEEKDVIFDILIKELGRADEHKSLLICWLLTELIEHDKLNDKLWDVIKSPKYNDNIKMIAFNMLKDLGNKVDYEVISGYFEKFGELINKETKEFLDTAIMNPEAQIDFMDFLAAISDDDKIILIRSLEEDYENDALANILIPVFLYYWNTEVGAEALDILGRTKSQLAFHALEHIKKYAKDEYLALINKAISELKISGVRVDNTKEFYAEILKESKPYKCYVSFPDGHGNIALIFSRIRNDKTLQFLAAVINIRFGVLDAFGFNSMSKDDFERIIDRFYNGQEKYEVKPGIIKAVLEQSVESCYIDEERAPYEYICWKSILLDVEPKEWKMKLEHKELSQKDIDDFCLSPYVQNWFFDEITKPEFNEFITKLSQEFKSNNFNVDLDKFIATNFDMIFTPEEIMNQVVKFNIAAYLRNSVGDKETAGIFYSLEDNYQFLTNIIRKSIYEYYVGKRYILNNQRQTASMFEKKLQPPRGEFELLQLDMIIACIEAKWVEHA